jgi:hypothetical protein
LTNAGGGEQGHAERRAFASGLTGHRRHQGLAVLEMAIGGAVGDAGPGGDGPQAHALLKAGLDERQGCVEEGLPEIAVVVAPLWAGETLMLTGPERRLQAACLYCAPRERSDASAFPFSPLVKGGRGGWRRTPLTS